MLGLLGLRIFEATSADITDLGEEHGHRVLRVCGKGTKVVLVPLPPAVGRAIDPAVASRVRGPILLNTRGTRMDRHAATRRLHRLAETAGIQIAQGTPAYAAPYFTSRPCSTLAPTCATCRSLPVTPTRARRYGMTPPERTRGSLDRHATYIVAAYVAGAAGTANPTGAASPGSSSGLAKMPI